jgi:hypothetical protein
MSWMEGADDRTLRISSIRGGAVKRKLWELERCAQIWQGPEPESDEVSKWIWVLECLHEEV